MINRLKVDNFLIVSATNKAHLILTKNWYESIKVNLGLTEKCLIIAFDDYAYDELVKSRIPTLKASSLIETVPVNDIEQEKYFSEEKDGEYNRLVHMKIDIAHALLKYYDMFALVYSDVDVVLLQKNIIRYFQSLYIDGNEFASVDVLRRDYDILITSSGRTGFFPCTGFYVAKKSDFSVSYLYNITRYPGRRDTGDQDTFNQIYKDNLTDAERRHVHPLNGVLFLDGNTRFRRDQFSVRPWLFHANWVVGLDMKIDLLMREGYWFIPNPKF